VLDVERKLKSTHRSQLATDAFLAHDLTSSL